jgi:hypothetical protein
MTVAFSLLSLHYVLERMKARKYFKPIMLFLICQRGDTFNFGSFSMGAQSYLKGLLHAAIYCKTSSQQNLQACKFSVRYGFFIQRL